jgi:hypothetical protein
MHALTPYTLRQFCGTPRQGSKALTAHFVALQGGISRRLLHVLWHSKEVLQGAYCSVCGTRRQHPKALTARFVAPTAACYLTHCLLLEA